MNRPERLELDQFLFALQDRVYVLVKLGSVSSYTPGGDLDIFCYSVPEVAKAILAVGNVYLEDGFEIRVVEKGEAHTYIDFYHCDELEFRFDLYGALPQYSKVLLKPHYFYSVIENATPLEREYQGQRYPVYIPSVVDDLLLRYVEYVEWYELRPDKVKHLDYILAVLANEPGRIGFLDKLHLYTALPEVTQRSPSQLSPPRRWFGGLKRLATVRLLQRAYGRLKRAARGVMSRLLPPSRPRSRKR